jgi:hypothetical protein
MLNIFCLNTAGYSSENKNVAIWDTLLPQKKALINGISFNSVVNKKKKG